MSNWSGLPRRQLSNLVRLVRVVGARAALSEGAALWVEIKLSGALGDVGGRASLGARTLTPGLLEILRILEAAERDPRLTGVLLRFDAELPGWAYAQSLRRSIEQLRAAGKRVVAWGASLGAQRYLAASACDRVWMPVSGSLGLVGIRSEHFYLRDFLDRWDVAPEVVHVGRFKNAGELLTRDSMSDTQREQIEAWQDHLFDALVDGIAQGRDLTPDTVRDAIDRGPYSAKAAAEAGLIDDCLYPDEIEAALEKLEGGGEEGAEAAVQSMPWQAYYSLRAEGPAWQPLLRKLPSIAYVVASGSIHQGSGRRGIASERLGELLERLATSDSVSGVVLRVDSPGGDAVASDLLYRSVQRLAAEKPVVVSMGNVAASGGYFLAAAAHFILAEAGTLTGSIGVVGGKLNLSGLYERLGIAKEAVERGARAGIHSEVRGFTPDERSAVVESMEAVYALFLERVADGRGRSPEDIEALAQGRIWSGAAAAEHGLVDALGGPLEALFEVRRRAGMGAHEPYELDVYPRRRPLGGLGALLRAFAEA